MSEMRVNDEYERIADVVMQAAADRITELESTPFINIEPRWKDSSEPRVSMPFVQIPKDGDLIGYYSPSSPRSIISRFKAYNQELKENLRLAGRELTMTPDGESGWQHILALPYGVAEEVGKGLSATSHAFESLSDQTGATPRKVLAGVVAASVILSGVNVLNESAENSRPSIEMASGEEIEMDLSDIVFYKTDKATVVELGSIEDQDVEQSISLATLAGGFEEGQVSVEEDKLILPFEADEDSVFASYAGFMAPDIIKPESEVSPAENELSAELERVRALEQRIIKEAVKYHGIKEDPSTPNHGPEIDKFFQMGLKGPNAQWCASYISRVLLDAGIPLTGGDKDGHKGPEWQVEFVNNVYLWGKDNGAQIFDRQQIRDGFRPKPGDLVIYNTDGKLGDARSGVNHIGIVESYDPETGMVNNIEGNYKDSVSYRRYDPSIKIDETNGKKLAGYIRLSQLIEPEAPSEIEAPRGDYSGDFNANMKVFTDEIVKYEGGINSVNTGNAGDTEIGSDKYNSIFVNRMLSELTIQELLDLQQSRTIFAIGKYQIVRDTMAEAVRVTGIDTNKIFDEATQDELAINYLIMGTKRPKLASYIKGEHNDLEVAVLELAKEWASIPATNAHNESKGRPHGASYYYKDSAGNSAHGGPDRLDLIREMLVNLRNSYSVDTENTVSADKPSQDDLIDMVMLGDSLTVGLENKNGGNIEAIDEEYGVNVIGIDAESGRSLVHPETSGLKAIEAMRPQIDQAEVVYLSFGTNAAESNDDFENGLRQSINDIKDEDTQVVIPKIYSETKSRDTRNEIIQRVAREEGAHVIDISSDVKLASDRVHPINYADLARRVLEEVSKLPVEVAPMEIPTAAPITAPSQVTTTTVKEENKSRLSNSSWFNEQTARHIYESYFKNIDGSIDEISLNEWMNTHVSTREVDGVIEYEVSLDNTPELIKESR